jgi:hypothetical protein
MTQGQAISYKLLDTYLSARESKFIMNAGNCRENKTIQWDKAFEYCSNCGERLIASDKLIRDKYLSIGSDTGPNSALLESL